MIKLITTGNYKLEGAKGGTQLLFLDNKPYHWTYAPKIGHLLTLCKHDHQPWFRITAGKYKIYEVKNEPNLVDLKHLQLSVGNNQWQGYLLLTDLPTTRKLRRRIEPTNEVISRKA